jgi:glutathione peroxidase
MNIYDYSVTSQKGESISLKQYEGKVVLIVNTATGCGFTPQYKTLEELYEKYHEKGLEIIDIPSNQFANQAPGTDEEITQFCTLHYNTKFAQMKKSEVNGADQLPLYAYLKSQAGFKGFGKGLKAKMMNGVVKKYDKGFKDNPDIKWNFTKFLVDRKGNVCSRYEPTYSLADLEKEIVSLL